MVIQCKGVDLVLVNTDEPYDWGGICAPSVAEAMNVCVTSIHEVPSLSAVTVSCVLPWSLQSKMRPSVTCSLTSLRVCHALSRQSYGGRGLCARPDPD
jgi:hypothetical protein